ncbi:15572_t:CDS:2, partial [Acaulospora colombiana]
PKELRYEVDDFVGGMTGGGEALLTPFEPTVMGEIISKIAESPTKIYTASLASAVLGYFAVKGLHHLFSKGI